MLSSKLLLKLVEVYSVVGLLADGRTAHVHAGALLRGSNVGEIGVHCVFLRDLGARSKVLKIFKMRIRKFNSIPNVWRKTLFGGMQMQTLSISKIK